MQPAKAFVVNNKSDIGRSWPGNAVHDGWRWHSVLHSFVLFRHVLFTGIDKHEGFTTKLNIPINDTDFAKVF